MHHGLSKPPSERCAPAFAGVKKVHFADAQLRGTRPYHPERSYLQAFFVRGAPLVCAEPILSHYTNEFMRISDGLEASGVRLETWPL